MTDHIETYNWNAERLQRNKGILDSPHGEVILENGNHGGWQIKIGDRWHYDLDWINAAGLLHELEAHPNGWEPKQ